MAWIRWWRRRGRDLTIRAVSTDEEAHAVGALLAQHLPEPPVVRFPEVVVQCEGVLHRELVGVWRDGDLIAGAFIGPESQQAQWLMANGVHDDAQAFTRLVAEIYAVAVEPAARRQGIGQRLKAWLDAWAREHHAYLVVSVPTTGPARHLNTAAHHLVCEPDVALCVRFKGSPVIHVMPATDATTWAVRILDQRAEVPLRVGVQPPVPRSHRTVPKVAWLDPRSFG